MNAQLDLFSCPQKEDKENNENFVNEWEQPLTDNSIPDITIPEQSRILEILVDYDAIETAADVYEDAAHEFLMHNDSYAENLRCINPNINNWEKEVDKVCDAFHNVQETLRQAVRLCREDLSVRISRTRDFIDALYHYYHLVVNDHSAQDIPYWQFKNACRGFLNKQYEYNY